MKRIYLGLLVLLSLVLVACSAGGNHTPLVSFYDLTFMLDDETVYHSFKVELDGPMLYPENPAKDGYVFEGWFVGDAQYTAQTISGNALTLYARFTEIDNTPPPDPGTYTGYYSSLDGLSGNAFKTQLETMIKTLGYATGSTNQVREADFYQGSYYLIYTGFGSYGNREHVWPNSKLGSAPTYDLHNLRAANIGVNSARANYPFTTGSGDWKLSGGAFYPGDEHVGDVARIVLYISVRYNLNLNLVGNLNMFLTWHEQDPVSPFELSRNDKIQNIQNNRNPFIDHPELVYALWPSATLSYQTSEVPPTVITYVPVLSFNAIFH